MPSTCPREAGGCGLRGRLCPAVPACDAFAFPLSTGGISLGSIPSTVPVETYSGVCQSPFLDNRWVGQGREEPWV